MRSVRCYPQTAHPNPPLAAAALSKRFGVNELAVLDWLALGLPQQADGRIDPFICCNWLSWNHLDLAPALKRLWRQFMAHFRPFITARDSGRSLQWRRESVLYLPDTVTEAQWYLPKMQSDFSWQAHALVEPLTAGEAQISEEAHYWALSTTLAQPHAEVTYDIEISPQRALDPSDSEYRVLLPLFKQVVASFDYHYRVHALDDQPNSTRTQGTCLDAALYAAQMLSDHGRTWRLCGGMIAHSALLNPHHWLEVETLRGWVPFDVSIPAIARMLGEDWELWAAHYCGGLDSGRIALTRGPGYWPVPEQNFISAATGSAVVTINGQAMNAWPCSDWVCGECDGLISQTASQNGSSTPAASLPRPNLHQ